MGIVSTVISTALIYYGAGLSNCSFTHAAADGAYIVTVGVTEALESIILLIALSAFIAVYRHYNNPPTLLSIKFEALSFIFPVSV